MLGTLRLWKERKKNADGSSSLPRGHGQVYDLRRNKHANGNSLQKSNIKKKTTVPTVKEWKNVIFSGTR
jgi:hypothetical protein